MDYYKKYQKYKLKYLELRNQHGGEPNISIIIHSPNYKTIIDLDKLKKVLEDNLDKYLYKNLTSLTSKDIIDSIKNRLITDKNGNHFYLNPEYDIVVDRPILYSITGGPDIKLSC